MSAMNTTGRAATAPARPDATPRSARRHISCVVPTHGRPQYLGSSLASVLAQTLPPDEVVVVSDIPDPAAAAVCRSLSTPAIPVRYLESDPSRRGASSSRNLGAEACSGDLLAFIDDDDLWDEDYLATAVAALEREGADLSVTWLTLFDEKSVSEGQRIRPELAAGDVGAANPGITGSNMIVTADAFAGIGGFDVDLPVKNDTDFLFRFLLAGYGYAVNADSRVQQRKHGDGQLTDGSARRADGMQKYLDKHRSALTMRDRRSLRLQIHRMRRAITTVRATRARHLLGIVANYSLKELRDRARHA